MMYLGNRKSLSAAILLATGSASISIEVSAASIEIDWQGWFTMVNRFGDPLLNSSIDQKLANRYITPVTGTLNYDDINQNGSIIITPFEFQSGSSPFAKHTDVHVSLQEYRCFDEA